MTQTRLFEKCPKCKGKKRITGIALFGELQSIPCELCNGTGKI